LQPHRTIAWLGAWVGIIGMLVSAFVGDTSMVGVNSGLYCTAALAGNLFVLQMLQGGARFKSGERPPEDSKLGGARRAPGVTQSFGLQKGQEDEAQETMAKEAAARATRNHTNALENVPLGLIVGWATLWSTKGVNEWQSLFFILFALMRCLHSIVYVRSLQPHRTIAWLGAWVGIIGMLVSAFVGDTSNPESNPETAMKEFMPADKAPQTSSSGFFFFALGAVAMFVMTYVHQNSRKAAPETASESYGAA